MSRSGYGDSFHDNTIYLYRANVDRAMKGGRGQKFLRELADAMDAMPEKVLISGELIRDDGAVCAIGVICKAKSIDVSKIDIYESREVGNLVGIASCLAAEIEYINDDDFQDEWNSLKGRETPEHRWERVRAWVSEQIGEAK